MTNSLNKMAGKNSAERNGGTSGRVRSTSKLRPLKTTSSTIAASSYINCIATPPRSKINSISSSSSECSTSEIKLRLSPSPSISVVVAAAIAPNGARTSPGLQAGHFAGGKWSDPPSPASLPKPPQHWTQLLAKCSTFANAAKPQHQQTDIASQLKVLLNVQA